MQSEREILTAVYAAFNLRDIDGALAWMRPDVDWPNGMEGGACMDATRCAPTGDASGAWLTPMLNR